MIDGMTPFGPSTMLPLHFLCFVYGNDHERDRSLANSHTPEMIQLVYSAYPGAAALQDEKTQRTPLHWILSHGGAPTPVIKLVHDFHPPAAAVQDSDGLYPLHYLCKRWRPQEAVLDQELMEITKIVHTHHPAAAFVPYDEAHKRDGYEWQYERHPHPAEVLAVSDGEL